MFRTVVSAIFCFVALSTLGPSDAHAVPCNADEFDAAEYHLSRYADRIAARDEGNRDVRADLLHCNIIRLAGELEIEVSVAWRGSLSGDRYWVQGELSMQLDGSNVRWSETAASHTVESWRSTRLIIGGVAVAACLSSDQCREGR